jgi:hypothetical protein
MHCDSMVAGLPKLVDTISSSSADDLFGFCSVPQPLSRAILTIRSSSNMLTCTEMPQFVEVQGRRNIAHGFLDLVLLRGEFMLFSMC